MEDLKIIGQKAKVASRQLASLGVEKKNEILLAVADALETNAAAIKEANAKDLDRAKKNGMSAAMLDRLTLTDARIEGCATGLRQLADLEDPVGGLTQMKKRPNGLMIGYKKVPIGVIGIIYESRPNVTVDAFGLTFKSGNAVILRGGSDSIESNLKLCQIIRDTIKEHDFDENSISLISDTDRKYVDELMHMNEYVDLLIPRGGHGLIQRVVMNSTVPVIETGTGNCHIYVDASADFDMALDIIFNAKTQRIGVCNACESLVVDKSIAKEFIPRLVDRLETKNVEVRGDEFALACDKRIVPASDEDWGKEYLDYIISLKCSDNIDQAITHINKYNTGHSEAIITEDYKNSMKFTEEIDAAAVYVNASTRFTDGFEFGFGAEIGISTQKIHARGPMGLDALTTGKYVILGSGQVRK